MVTSNLYNSLLLNERSKVVGSLLDKNMQSLDEQIRAFGELFRDRLDNELLQYAINYLDHNERGLALETLLDYLADYEVIITQAEYDQAVILYKQMKLDINDHRIKYLNILGHT